MQCRDFEPFFSQYIDGELERNRSESIRFHLSGCPRCRLILEEMQQAVNAVQGLPRLAPRPEFAEALRQRLHQEITQDLYQRPGWPRWAEGLTEFWWAGLQRSPQIAVAFILVVAVGVGMFIFQSGPPAGRVNETLNTQRPASSFGQTLAVSAREERARAERSGDASRPLSRLASSPPARQDRRAPQPERAEFAAPPDSAALFLTSNPPDPHWVLPQASGDGMASARGSIVDGRSETMHYLLPTIPSRPRFSRVAF